MTAMILADAGLFWAHKLGPDEWEIGGPQGARDHRVVFDAPSLRYVLDGATDHATLMDAMCAVVGQS